MADNWDDEIQDECEHLIEYGRRRKYDGGRCPVLCEGCRLIIGWWELAEGGTMADGPFLVHEYMCIEPEHARGCPCSGEPIEYLLGPEDQLMNQQVPGQTSLET